MGTMVVGMFPNHDNLTSLTEALKAAGYNVERLRIISSDTPKDDLIRSGAQFVYSGDSESTAIGSGGGIITGFGGMGVPGLTEGGPRLPTIESFHSTEDLLGELEIPGARFEDYCKALDAGRSVAGYNAGTDVEKVKALFSGCGGYPVEVF